MLLSCDSSLAAITQHVGGSRQSCIGGDSLTQNPLADDTGFEMLSLLMSVNTTLAHSAYSLTCKIGFKRVVCLCLCISDPQPRQAFTETGCTINIKTIES